MAEEQIETTTGEKPDAYNPQGTAASTHDIRVQKHETPHANLLQPLSKKKEDPTITIPLDEYQKLKSNESLKILGLHWDKTKLPPDEAKKLARAVADKNVHELLADEARKIEKKAAAKTQQAVQKALDDAKKKSQSKKKANNYVHIALSLLAILATGAITWSLKPQQTYKLTQTAATIVTDAKRQENVLQWAFTNVQETIWWITWNPDPRIVKEIQNALKRKPTLACIIVCTPEAEIDFAHLSPQLNITTFALQNSIGPINWLILDEKLILDTTSKSGISIIPDPRKARELKEWADRELAPNSKHLYKEQ